MYKKLLFFMVFCLVSAPLAQGGEVADKVQDKYESLNSLKADVKQIVTNAATGQKEKREGKIYFRQPQLIRWVTESPEKEILVVGKDAVWDYFPAEDTVYKYSVSQMISSKTVLRFISGKAKLQEDFQVKRQGREHGLLKLKLVPYEPESNLVLAYLWVDEEDWLAKRVLVVDYWGNGNELRLSGISINARIPDSRFNFEPPPGVEMRDNAGTNAKPEME